MAAVPKAEKYKTKAGFRYRGRYFHPDHTWCERGIRRGHCKGHTDGLSGKRTAKEALLAAQKRQVLIAGAGPSSAASGLSLDAVCAKWLDSGPTSIKSPQTLDWYRDTWRSWKTKNPLVGQIAVSDVTPLHVSTWLGALRDSGLAQSTLDSYTFLLRHILRYAVTPMGVRSDNPSDGITAPASKLGIPAKTARLTEEQVWRLAAVLPTPYNTLVLVGAYTGLRLGELSGLREEYLDRSSQPYVISVAWQWDERRGMFRAPKRNKTRQVPVNPELSTAIDKHVLQRPPSMNQYDLVFAARNGAPLRQSNFRSQVWYPALQRSGLPRVTPHSLRGTFVDIWIDRGMLMTNVRDMAGHKDIAVTMNVYKGSASAEKLSDAVMMATMASKPAALQQAVNAAVGVMQVIDTHRDGRIDLVGLHPDWVPESGNGSEAKVLRLPPR